MKQKKINEIDLGLQKGRKEFNCEKQKTTFLYCANVGRQTPDCTRKQNEN